MNPFRSRLASRKAQHLVFLAHVWACAPFLFFWVRDIRVQQLLGESSAAQMQSIIGLTLLYLAVRTYLAWKDPVWIKWEYVFPPIDVCLVSAILFLSHRGPMSNITLLFFLPMVSAAGSLNVRWAAAVGFMVVAGTAVSTLAGATEIPVTTAQSAQDLLQADPLNVAFRVYFLIVLSSLMAFQSSIAAGLQERLAVAADRNRIALDMHDGVQGHLISLSQQLELMSRIVERDPVRAVSLAKEGKETAQSAADELRFLVQRLRNPSLPTSFSSALRQYAHNICQRHDLQMEFDIEGREEPLTPEQENALFRISQEALTNIVKHAEADTVCIKVRFSHPVELRITDNGVGLEKKGRGDGIGLESMRSRMENLEGRLEITSPSEGGTCVRAVFGSGGVA